ncbi:hypothetical protein NMY22_g18515 [Coprinellus aureogranulatus]|nr:hypothetical protein NMY22_g18515 [Coprinellus aureogranulatus]
MSTPSSKQAATSGELLDLVSHPSTSSTSTAIYPTDDALLSVLQARFRGDLPYSAIGSNHLVVVNPYKVLGNVNEESAREYEEKCYKDTSGKGGEGIQPHLYDAAAKVYLLMRRKKEAQAVVARCVHLLVFIVCTATDEFPISFHLSSRRRHRANGPSRPNSLCFPGSLGIRPLSSVPPRRRHPLSSSVPAVPGLYRRRSDPLSLFAPLRLFACQGLILLLEALD